MKRALSTIILLAFVLVDAAPCRAGFPACGMKMPLQNELCGSCAGDTGSGPVLKAASCCRSVPGQDRSVAPAVLSGASAGSSTPAKAALAAAESPAAPAIDAVGGALVDHPTGSGPPLLPIRSTVLRL
jgi:hypothetical protein